MRDRGLDAPDEDATSWTFEQFAAAAEFATRPRRGTKGVHIAPTLPGLAPFIESGGGSVFDDAVDPTSLAFSSDDSQAALERTLRAAPQPARSPSTRTSSPRPRRWSGSSAASSA